MADSTPYIASIAMFAGNFAPRGFAFCAGQLLSISQNTALFSILGTTFGGDGRVTFALPDLRGRAPVGQGQGPGLPAVILGEVAGQPNVTLISSQLPVHNHLINANKTASDAPNPQPNVVLGPYGDSASPQSLYSTAAPNTTLSPLAMGNAGGNQPVNVQNPFLGINFIIALVGIFPSRN
jgi:microcystin-dependent protein